MKLTVKEVAAAQRLDPATVREHIAKGLPATQQFPSGRYLIEEADMLAFYERGKKAKAGQVIDARSIIDEAARRAKERVHGQEA